MLPISAGLLLPIFLMLEEGSDRRDITVQQIPGDVEITHPMDK